MGLITRNHSCPSVFRQCPEQGMVSTMDRSIAGSLLSQSSLVNYHDSYSYDAFGRLEGHQQLNGTTPRRERDSNPRNILKFFCLSILKCHLKAL